MVSFLCPEKSGTQNSRPQSAIQNPRLQFANQNPRPQNLDLKYYLYNISIYHVENMYGTNIIANNAGESIGNIDQYNYE